MNNKIRLNRLNHALTVLKAIPKKKFEMGFWMKRNFFDKPLNIKIPDNFVNVSCTSAACALGWFASDRTFRRAGLRWYETANGDGIDYNNHKDQYAGAAFFGLTSREADNLFLPDRYMETTDDITPRHVAERIRKLIKKYAA